MKQQLKIPSSLLTASIAKHINDVCVWVGEFYTVRNCWTCIRSNRDRWIFKSTAKDEFSLLFGSGSINLNNGVCYKKGFQMKERKTCRMHNTTFFFFFSPESFSFTISISEIVEKFPRGIRWVWNVEVVAFLFLFLFDSKDPQLK